MNNSELKIALLKMHTRDKRLTYINYILIALVILVVLVFLGEILLKSVLQVDALYPKIVLAIAVLMYLGYAIYRIVSLNKRAKDIDELFNYINNGAKATNVIESKAYKIIIPLGKSSINLYPIDYLSISLDKNPMKAYSLPVHANIASELKKAVSGVDTKDLRQTLTDIYSNNELKYDDNEKTPLKTQEEFKTFLNTELSGEVGKVEENRKQSRKTMVMLTAASIAVAVGFMGYMYFNAFTNPTNFTAEKIYIPMLVIFGAFYVFYFIFIRPRQMEAFKKGATLTNAPDYDFKTKVFEKMIKFVSPNAQYAMHGHISPEEFRESGLFRAKRYDITGNDLIIGRHNGVPFQFCDLTVSVEKRITKENDDPDYAFYGQYFVARFNKSFSSPVYLIPKKGVKGFFSGNEIDIYTEVSGEKIMLEDPEFMKMFQVYGEDQIEARYILTTSLMERIKQLAIRTKGQFYISFFNNKITVANNSGKNNFELKQSKSITKNDNQLLLDFYQDLCDQFALIDELKLNVKIWK